MFDQPKEKKLLGCPHNLLANSWLFSMDIFPSKSILGKAMVEGTHIHTPHPKIISTQESHHQGLNV